MNVVFFLDDGEIVFVDYTYSIHMLIAFSNKSGSMHKTFLNEVKKTIVNFTKCIRRHPSPRPYISKAPTFNSKQNMREKNMMINTSKHMQSFNASVPASIVIVSCWTEMFRNYKVMNISGKHFIMNSFPSVTTLKNA